MERGYDNKRDKVMSRVFGRARIKVGRGRGDDDENASTMTTMRDDDDSSMREEQMRRDMKNGDAGNAMR